MSSRAGQGWKSASPETIKERIRAKLQREPKASNEKIRRCVKGSNAALIAEVRGEGGNKTVASPEQKKVIGKTLDQFKKEFDVRVKIRDGLKRIGAKNYLSDTEFREFCGVHISVWRRYAELDEFKPNRVRIQGTLYWAREEMIVEMKDIVNLI